MFLRISQQAPIGDQLPSYNFEPGDCYTGNSDWSDCRRCRLHHTRHRVAIKRTGGTGSTRLLFIGEAPGELENKTGVPFVGIAGKILYHLFKHTHFQFQYCITNTVGCRPVDVIMVDEDYELSDELTSDDYELINWNREPTKAEIELCKPHIDELLEWYQPHGVVYLGKIAESYKDPKYLVHEAKLLHTDAKLFRHTAYKKDFVYRHVPTLSLFRPAYIAKLEYKLLTIRKEAKKLDEFVERFL